MRQVDLGAYFGKRVAAAEDTLFNCDVCGTGKLIHDYHSIWLFNQMWWELKFDMERVNTGFCFV